MATNLNPTPDRQTEAKQVDQLLGDHRKGAELSTELGHANYKA